MQPERRALGAKFQVSGTKFQDNRPLRLLILTLENLIPDTSSAKRALSRRSFSEGGLRFRAKSAHEKDNQADQQDQAEATAADGRTANIKTAAAEQEKKDNYE